MPEVHVAADPASLAAAAAREVARIARQAVRERGGFSVALAGGTTPRLLYRELATPAYEDLPWDRTAVYFGDERCVPPEHEESNYRMARESLLGSLRAPGLRVFRMEGELAVPQEAADRYEEVLWRTAGVAPGTTPRLDLVLLGLGADGHTASLFPGSPALREARRLVAAPWVVSLEAYRLTLTLPILNAARAVIFLVSGAAKSSAARRAIDDRDPDLPAARVHPLDGRLLWMVDRAAGSELEPAS